MKNIWNHFSLALAFSACAVHGTETVEFRVATKMKEVVSASFVKKSNKICFYRRYKSNVWMHRNRKDRVEIDKKAMKKYSIVKKLLL